jgi:hypothetical protein
MAIDAEVSWLEVKIGKARRPKGDLIEHGAKPCQHSGTAVESRVVTREERRRVRRPARYETLPVEIVKDTQEVFGRRENPPCPL